MFEVDIKDAKQAIYFKNKHTNEQKNLRIRIKNQN